jgi:hypothetical protein
MSLIWWALARNHWKTLTCGERGRNHSSQQLPW